MALKKLAERAVEWQSWSGGKLFWHLFEKYQPILAVRFPSLRLGSAVRAVYLGVMVSGLCFVNALLFEYSPAGGVPKDERCEDAGHLSLEFAVVNGAVTTLCKMGVVMLVTELAKKELHYQCTEDERRARRA